MRAIQESMFITIQERGMTRLQDRLSGRLERASQLRCEKHDKSVVAVAIHGLENGWFDATWTTCCDGLTQQAVAIVKERC